MIVLYHIALRTYENRKAHLRAVVARAGNGISQSHFSEGKLGIF